MVSYASFAKSRLKEHIEKFDLEIRKYAPQFAQQITNYHKTEEQARDTFIDYLTRPAKRLRGSFVIEGYELFGGKKREQAVLAGLAIEMIHAYILMIDDFSDLSDLRRGKPTSHKLFEEYLKSEDAYRGDSVHYGYSVGATTALIGSHEAISLFLELDIPLKSIKKAVINLNNSVVVTAFGQIRDIYNSHIRDLTIEDIIEVHKLKTARYTYTNPLQIGAILADASDNEINMLSGYATNAGIAFQIQDDILGVFGDPKDTGKSNMDDIKEGKATLLTVYAYNNCSDKEREILDRGLGNKDISDDDFKKIQEIMISTGSLQHSKDIAKKYVNTAKEEFEKKFSEYSELDSYKFIVGIADYMIERDL